MVTDGSYTFGKHSLMYKEAELLYCIPETNIILCVNYTQLKQKQKLCFSTTGDLPRVSRGHMTISGDISVCHKLGGWEWRRKPILGTKWAEARDAAIHPTLQRISLHKWIILSKISIMLKLRKLVLSFLECKLCKKRHFCMFSIWMDAA